MKDQAYKDFLARTCIERMSAEKPVEILFAGDVCVGTVGEISCIVGKPKVKKTFNMIAIAAAALSGKKVAGWMVKLPDEKPKVLYVDTEQSRFHTERTRKRICLSAGTSIGDSHLIVINIKKLSGQERLEFLQELLKREGGIGLVILDGVRDLVGDINDNKAAHEVAELIDKWCDDYGIHLVTTLHLNKTDKSPRGHLGAEITAKAESVIMLEKEKNDESTKVSPLELRDVEFSPFWMTVNDDGLPVEAK